MGGTSRSVAWAMGWMLTATSLGACRVSESDVHRWESTERGPHKLVAVVTHDKYSWELRTEAALSLIRMSPRGGVRQGIKYLADRYKDEDGIERPGALVQLSEESRRKVVDLLAPELIKQMQAPPPARTPDNRLPPDPTVPYKDAAFAMLSHEPPLVGNDKTRADLAAALTQWAQTGFEDRIENSAQQFGIEQMMRFLGAPSVKALPQMIDEKAYRIDRIAGLVAELGDPDAKLRASNALVALAKKVDSPEWMKAKTQEVTEHNKKSGVQANEAQVSQQVSKILDRRLNEEIFPAMKKVGGRPAVDFLFGYAADTKHPEERRKLALAALEGRLEKNNPQDLERMFAIAKEENTPDGVRDVAFARLGEFNKDQILPKLYTLFENKKWKVRWVAASLALRTINTKQIPEFMGHLPKSSGVKMGMSEPLTYGPLIAKMEGDPKPKDVIAPFLASRDFGAKVTAASYYYEGKAADVGLLKPLEDDGTPVPKCEKDDECGWTCDVQKPGTKDRETKELKTVGEFVRFCVIPSMDKK